jgi:hypothetical protein
MTTRTLSRDDLKGLAEKKKHGYINYIIDEKYINSIELEAAVGETSFSIEHEIFHHQINSQLLSYYMVYYSKGLNRVVRKQPTHPGNMIGQNQLPETLKVTSADVIVVLNTRFPACNISYQETWVDTDHNTKNLWKRYVIDWS